MCYLKRNAVAMRAKSAKCFLANASNFHYFVSAAADIVDYSNEFFFFEKCRRKYVSFKNCAPPPTNNNVLRYKMK